jgi:hypothetical protein
LRENYGGVFTKLTEGIIQVTLVRRINIIELLRASETENQRNQFIPFINKTDAVLRVRNLGCFIVFRFIITRCTTRQKNCNYTCKEDKE